MTVPTLHAAQPHALSQESVSSRSTPAREAFAVFSRKEAKEAGAALAAASRPRSQFEHLGDAPRARDFEPPEQRLARLQAEVADLLRVADGALADGEPGQDVLGGDPAAVTAELKVLEQRLGGLARDGPSVWQGPGSANETPGASHGSYVMSQSLVSQLERMGAGSHTQSQHLGDGRVTYEINYSPGTEGLADSAKIAALESSIAQIERRIGTLDPACPFSDMQTAVLQLQKRMSLLDTAKIDAIHRQVAQVKNDVEDLLKKKADLQGSSPDCNLDQKVNELYELCHRWNATSTSLPMIVTRLRTLQALHQQSASFSTRLSTLEQQQEEIVKLLETTSSAVKEVGSSLKENMTIVKENMSSLEEKMKKVGR